MLFGRSARCSGDGGGYGGSLRYLRTEQPVRAQRIFSSDLHLQTAQTWWNFHEWCSAGTCCRKKGNEIYAFIVRTSNMSLQNNKFTVVSICKRYAGFFFNHSGCKAARSCEVKSST